MTRFRALLALLLSLPLAACAGLPRECEGVLRPGERELAFQLVIEAESRTARIILPSSTYIVFPLTIEDDRYHFYDLLPGNTDERVETRRMFRYDEAGHHMVYIDNDAGIFLIGQCEPGD